MFEAKDIIGDAVRNSLSLFGAHVRGDVIAWERIEKAAHFTRLSPHWTQFQKRLRRDFLQLTGILLWPVPGVGLELVHKDDQLTRCQQSRQRRALRQMTRGVKELKALPDSQLTDHQRAMKHRKLDQARAARRAVLYSVRLGHKLAKSSCVR